jgi:GNAT superfamily N-acetyltransferase
MTLKIALSPKGIFMTLDLSKSGKSRQIQENMIAYMRLFAGISGVFIYEDAETFWTVSESAPGTAIFRASFPEHREEESIDALFAQVGQHVDHIDWMVYPVDQPDDLSQRLEARGMPGGPGGNWLWANLESRDVSFAMPDGFRVEQVRDDPMMAEWIRMSEAGFGGTYPHFYDAYARHGYGADAFSLHYIGYQGDIPVTSGTMLDAGGTASIYDISTPPALRGKGFGGAITAFLMGEIRNRGYADTWIWASDMAKSVYQKLGYIDADFGMREHTWRKSA